MRETIDPSNSELEAVMEGLIREDVTITAREVARRHPKLHNASAFTRSPARRLLVELFQQRQADARHVKDAPAAAPNEREKLSLALQVQQAEVTRLTNQVRNLVAAHVGVLKAVQATGGMRSLERFWAEYKAVADTLSELSDGPSTAQVIQLHGNASATQCES